jgi:hypothetical protein
VPIVGAGDRLRVRVTPGGGACVGKLYVWVGELRLTEKGHQVTRRPFFNAPLSGMYRASPSHPG